MTLSFTVPGAPRTKKNHGEVVFNGPRCPCCKRGKFPKVLPSPQFREWNEQAQLWLMKVKVVNPPEGPQRRRAIAVEVNCRALFYRDKLTGDANGYYQALADALEEAGIVENDRLIVSWNGSLLLKDAKNPRIEVTLEAIQA